MNIERGELVSTVKVGSLFDGIGGTPLSAMRAGAEPVWASEIEKWPISITKRHFPNMKHLGDITQINGAEIEPVDIIVGGSPCQDLSVAGKREGLDGERSGLFMDQCRIVKEMRNATRQADNGSTEFCRPRYMVWENVPGAFSSNKGEDFRAVLEEIARIADDKASIPGPPKGKWLRSGTILGDGYSISWRTVDAQYWGVPQRRRRIYLVADFGGSSAPEICFEREGVSGDFEASGEARKGAARTPEGGFGATGESAGFIGMMGSKARSIGYAEEQSPTLSAQQAAHVVCYPINTMAATRSEGGVGEASELCLNDQAAVCYSIGGFNSEGMKSSNPHSGVYEADTSRTIDQNGGNPACNQGGVAVVEPVCFDPRSQDGVHRIHGDVVPTLNTAQGGQRQPCVCYGLAKPPQYIVRRLTPLECERLQGYPDGWTQFDEDGKEISDTQRYKALGNSFAVPNAYFFISRCVQVLNDQDPTGWR